MAGRLGNYSWPGLTLGLRAVERARAPLRGLPSLGLLGSHHTTFHPAATVCLGKVAL